MLRLGRSSILITWVAWMSLSPGSHGAPASSNPQTRAHASAPAIVIGFVGGFVKRDDSVHAPVQLAARLRGGYPSGVSISVYENRHREEALAQIRKLLDTDRNGSLSDEEKRNAHIVIYGISWGGAATVEIARDLEKEHIPVLLTIQVDSVAKPGQNDGLIPANVAEAVNFYQPNGLLHGQSKIQAADSTRTRILGNYRLDYSANPIECPNYPWYDLLFSKPHTEIECDPRLWSQVESLIRAKLPASGAASAQSPR